MDTDVSLEEAYIARFQGRSAGCRAALIDIDPDAGKAVANKKTYAAFLARYKNEAKTDLDARDARFYALFFDRTHVTKQTENWYIKLAELGDEEPLLEFYVCEGMATAALERFKTLEAEEVEIIVDVNMHRLKGTYDYDEHRVMETIKACASGEYNAFLCALLVQCIKDAQFTSSVLVANALGRQLNGTEAYTLGCMLIRKRLREPETLKFIKRIPSLQLSSAYIDAIIDGTRGKADEVFAQAKGLKYELTFSQLQKVYELAMNRLNINLDSLEPNIWIPVIEEMARRSDEWKEKLVEAYEIAARQSLRKLKAAQAAYFADKQGLPLRPIELYIQYHYLKSSKYEKRLHQTRAYARELLLKHLEERLGKPEPD